MALVSLYNHTRLLFNSQCRDTDDYIVNLYSVLPFAPAATTKALAEAGATQLPTLNGYAQDFTPLPSVQTVIYQATGCAFKAANPSWLASGGPLTATKALICNATLANSPPLFYIDLEGTLSAPDGQSLIIQWHVDGIYITKPPA
jgi:hypothetical protein